MNTRIFRACLAFAGLLPLAPSAFAAEAFDNCTGFIDTLPATVSTQGTWCLRKDLATAMTSGNAITIGTSNVTIDCNGYKLGGLAAGPATLGYGINATNRTNTVIRHCNIRGFFVGAAVQGDGALVEDNRFEGNTTWGLFVDGAEGTIRRNMVVSTGNSTAGVDATGISAHGDIDVIDNTIDTVLARTGGSGMAIGLDVVDSTGASIADNRIRNVLGDGSGATYGIASSNIVRVTFADNQVIGAGPGKGIVCTASDSPAKGNTVAGFQTALEGCDNVAGSNLTQ